ncbi:LysR family transcriptional regulator [Chelativorans sp. YIM 93263]|uniref:LysR family transcriptional regulator n=1 Tax=Chelativorans sp. YIM 93263 TaxID=2906648 RepID=UPI002379C63C|nr:LysR family transcriptional regulator [Chelativorans sp. YIM 93263]
MEAHPTLDQLEIFLAVVEEGGFSAAARKLNRAQSVISYGVSNLEAQLGLQLFERTGTRQPRLTESGASLLQDARRMIAGLQMLRARAHGLAQGLEGEVRLAVDVLVPMPVLTVVLESFRTAYPTVGVRLYTGALGAAADVVMRGEANIGIVGEAMSSLPELVSHLVGGNQISPVAAPSHPLARADAPVPKAVLREYPQVVISDLSRWTDGRDFHVYALNTWRVSDLATKHALISAGLGWGGLPVWLIHDELESGRLVALSLEPYPPSNYSMFAIRRDDKPFGPAASWMAERFEAAFADFSRIRK